MLRLILTVAIAWIVSGCASLDLKRPVAPEDLRSSKKVGVVSLLGTTFRGITVGTTVFNNSAFAADVAAWNVDQTAAAQAVQLLRTNSQLDAVALDHPADAAPPTKLEVPEWVWDTAQRQRVDRLIVLKPAVAEMFAAYRPSYGLFERSFLGVARRCVYASYLVNAYDVATKKSIGWQWGGAWPCQHGSHDSIPMKAAWSDYSSEEQAMLRAEVEARLARGTYEALTELQIIRKSTSPQGQR